MKNHRTTLPTFKSSVIALLLMLLVVTCFTRLAYSDLWGPDHSSSGVLTGWVGKGNCLACHGGACDSSNNDKAPVEVSRIFEGYRCIACHLSVSKTRSLVEDFLRSPHNILGCSECHDTHHQGHSKYLTNTPGLYGCLKPGCHGIVTQDYTPPPSASNVFVITHPGAYTGYIVFPGEKTIFNPGDSTAATKTIYPASFVDPNTGLFGDIPSTNRYWVCLRCHFVNTGNPTTINATASRVHDDKCYFCHSSSFNDAHNITYDNDFFITTACTHCHNSVGQSVANSIHSSIGCRCHSVEHISKYNGSAAWVFLFAPPPGDYVTPAIPADFLSWLKPLYYDATTNATALGVNVYPIYKIDPTGTVTGPPSYLNMTYVLRNGDASLITGKVERLMTCFNCHFVADEPHQASIVDLLRGYVVTPDLDPHTIRLPAQTTTSIESTQPNTHHSPNTAVILVIAVATLILMIRILAQAEHGS